MTKSAADALECGRFRLGLDRPLLMGILNVTPDSFSDGGRFLAPAQALEQARRMVADGADIIDVGAESTRPGAEPLGPGEEWARLEPVLRGLRDLGVPISVDTRHADIMALALTAGVDLINDVGGFTDRRALEVLARHCGAGQAAAVCVMHMQGEPPTMQQAPAYRDVVSEIADFLYLQSESLLQAGVSPRAVIVDPGIGFGKTQEQNIELLRSLPKFAALGFPVLVGVSRKSLVGHLTGRAPGERMAGSVGSALAAAHNGASILRVHDVRETRDALMAFRTLVNK